MAVVTQPITNVAASGDISKLKLFSAELTALITPLSKYSSSIKNLALAISDFTSQTMQSLDPVLKLSNRTNLTVSNIQALGYAASVSGSSAQALETSLDGLNHNLDSAVQNGIDNFAQLGINIRDSSGQLKQADSLLLEVGQQLRGLGSAAQQDLASTLGIDPTVIALITQSKDEIEALQNQALAYGTVTTTQYKQIINYNQAMATLMATFMALDAEMSYAFSALQLDIAIGLLPLLTEITTVFNELIVENRAWISAGLLAVITVLKTLGTAITRLLTFVWDLAVGLTGSKKGAVILGAALMFALVPLKFFAGALAFALSPVTLITVGIVALLLIFSDLVSAFEGGESIIRDVFLSFFGFDITPVLQGMVGAIKQVFDVMRGVVKAVIAIMTLDFGGFYEAIKQIFAPFALNFDAYVIKPIADKFSQLATFFSTIFAQAFAWIKQQLINILPDWVKKGLAMMGVDIDSGDGEEYDTANQQRLLYQAAQQSISAGDTANYATKYSSNVTNAAINMYVNSNNALDAANAVDLHLRDSLNDLAAQNNARSGR